ncbi:MAG: DeoR/GlpR family DNA-binding transcription regulator [Athalassotoga sp.]|uniref:DeoR/GlpR family DNA-binding transcription regulator n=1 Tax=Athalassotoga sp. TaxID=2022597 RepID=UPI003D0927FD
MLAVERRQRIIDLLKEEKYVPVDELAKMINTSIATVRRDLTKLENDGFLLKIRGGATLSARSRSEISFQKRMSVNTEEKKMIAKKAIEFIQDGDTIILDAGTTTFFIAKEIINMKINVTIITNSLMIAKETANYPDFNLIFIGGKFDWKNMATIGSSAINFVSDLSVDKAFIGANGFDAIHGAMSFGEDNATLNKMMANAAKRVFIVSDSSKISKSAFFTSVSLEKIDTLITDRALDAELIKALEGKGIKVEIAR